MRSATIVRVVIAATALAVTVSLTLLERDHDRCEDATRGAFLASRAPEGLLQDRIDTMLSDCSGSQALTSIAVGLHAERPRAAARLARVAAEREPDSYEAWAVLAIAGPPSKTAVAARRARELNPLSASAAGP